MRLIDADWVAERLKEWRNWIAETYGENDDYVLCLDTVLMKLDDAPTTNTEPTKHGRWECYGTPNGSMGCECSACKYRITIIEPKYGYLYCPHCGAKMDEMNNETN